MSYCSFSSRFQAAPLQPPWIQCTSCHMTFSDQSAINAHYVTVHARSNRPGRPEHPNARHSCQHCGRKFTTKQHLEIHLSTIHGVGNVTVFQCDRCSKILKTKGALTRHMALVHGVGDVPELMCHLCSKVMRQKGHLRTHLACVHGVDVQEYRCGFCSKSFKLHGHLKLHEKRVHFR